MTRTALLVVAAVTGAGLLVGSAEVAWHDGHALGRGAPGVVADEGVAARAGSSHPVPAPADGSADVVSALPDGSADAVSALPEGSAGGVSALPDGSGGGAGAPAPDSPSVLVRAGAPTVPHAAARSRGDSARWQWPLHPRPGVLRRFRAPVSDYGAGHRGLDLAARDGADVLAVEGGVVTHAGFVAGRGTVTVEHLGGLRSTYEPLRPSVAVGDVVAAGKPLGTVRSRDGPAHCGVRTCLHLGARRAGSYLDPDPLLVAGRLALLPLR